MTPDPDRLFTLLDHRRMRATQGSSKPGSRSAFWSKVKVQEQPALVPSAAIVASANEPALP